MLVNTLIPTDLNTRMSRCDGLLFPTRLMTTAVNLREQQGLDDAEIGRRLNLSREWVCKLRREYKRRMDAIQLACAEAGGDASIIRRLISVN
jgi:orotate phosphoribosyltransferase-like protein